jgi:hypothetical protein
MMPIIAESGTPVRVYTVTKDGYAFISNEIEGLWEMSIGDMLFFEKSTDGCVPDIYQIPLPSKFDYFRMREFHYKSSFYRFFKISKTIRRQFNELDPIFIRLGSSGGLSQHIALGTVNDILITDNFLKDITVTYTRESKLKDIGL